MSERVWVKAQPLSFAEQAARFNSKTTVKIETTAERFIINRKWERDTDESPTTYGWAEYRQLERHVEGLLDLAVPFSLNMPELSAVILAEIQRQRCEQPIRPDVAGV